MSFFPWHTTYSFSLETLHTLYPMKHYMYLIPWNTTCPFSMTCYISLLPWNITCPLSHETLHVPYPMTHYISFVHDTLDVSYPMTHYNKNRWRGGPLYRSCELFCVRIFHESEGRVKYHYTKQWTWSPQGIPHSLFLFLCCTIDVISNSGILPVLCDLHQRSRYADHVQNRP